MQAAEADKALEMTDDDLRHLRGLVPFHTLSEAAFEQLHDAIEFRLVASGEALFGRGDMAPISCYLLRGYVGLYAGGTEVDSIAAGSPTARFPLAHRLPREVTARALTRSRVATINSGALNAALKGGRRENYVVDEVNPTSGDDWMSRILRSPVFNRISAANIETLINRMQEIDRRQGDVIIRQGDQGDYYYVIKTGSCDVVRQNRQGDDMLLATLEDGDSFGEEALLSGAPRSTTVSAATDATLLRLRKDDFVELIKRPVVGYCNVNAAKGAVDGGGLWLDIRADAADAPLPMAGECRVAQLREIRAISATLPKERQIVVVCEDGSNATTAAFLLLERGFNAIALRGGLAGVEAAQRSPAKDLPASDASDSVAVADAQPDHVDAALADQVQAMSTQVQSLQAALATAEARLMGRSEAAHAARDMETQLNAAQERIAQLDAEQLIERDAVGQAVAEADRLRQALDQAQAEFDQHKLRLQAKAEQLGEKVRTAEASAHERQRRIDRLEEQRVRQQEAMDRLQDKLSEQSDRLTVLELADEQAQGQLKEREWRIAELEALIQQHADAIEAAQVNSDSDLVQALRTELDLVRAQAKADLSALRRELDLARAGGTRAQASIAS